MQELIIKRKGSYNLDFKKERNRKAMKRHISFWKRELSDRILAEFGAEGDVTLEPVKTEGVVSEDFPPLYEDVPKMLADFEKSIDQSDTHEKWRITDDGVRIPVAWPELQFGNGMGGAIFGARLITTGTEDHTYTFNKPLIKDWSQVYDLRFDSDNNWVQRILFALDYFTTNASRDFVIRPFFIYEGLDFIVAMRGTTRAFFDVADKPAELKVLYDIGRDAGIQFFEMKKDIIRDHNERVLDYQEYSDMAPIHSIPMLDMDAYALCSVEVFEEYGFENKQKILDHFNGGSFYIHALGSHIVKSASELKNLTELWLFDDPKCPRYFDNRIHWRKITNDIPLQLYCNLDEFIKALEEKSLPGGVKYNIFTSGENISIEDKNNLFKKIEKYRTEDLKGKPVVLN
jgi:hypothetical protein